MAHITLSGTLLTDAPLLYDPQGGAYCLATIQGHFPRPPNLDPKDKAPVQQFDVFAQGHMANALHLCSPGDVIAVSGALHVEVVSKHKGAKRKRFTIVSDTIECAAGSAYWLRRKGTGSAPPPPIDGPAPF